MASVNEVKEYLAHWFQLGKGVIFSKSGQNLLPHPVFEGTQFSAIFEDYWQQILDTKEDCYLDGTEQSIKELLASTWDIIDCSRCTLPVPVNQGHCVSSLCPCADIPSWPNLELPLPKIPSNNERYLSQIKSRLQEKESEKLDESKAVD